MQTQRTFKGMYTNRACSFLPNERESGCFSRYAVDKAL